MSKKNYKVEINPSYEKILSCNYEKCVERGNRVKCYNLEEKKCVRYICHQYMLQTAKEIKTKRETEGFI